MKGIYNSKKKLKNFDFESPTIPLKLHQMENLNYELDKKKKKKDKDLRERRRNNLRRDECNRKIQVFNEHKGLKFKSLRNIEMKIGKAPNYEKKSSFGGLYMLEEEDGYAVMASEERELIKMKEELDRLFEDRLV